MLDGSLRNQRIFAIAAPINGNTVIEALKMARPDVDASKLKTDPNELRDLTKVDNELGARLLREWYGQDEYKPLHQSIKENLEGI